MPQPSSAAHNVLELYAGGLTISYRNVTCDRMLQSSMALIACHVVLMEISYCSTNFIC